MWRLKVWKMELELSNSWADTVVCVLNERTNDILSFFTFSLSTYVWWRMNVSSIWFHNFLPVRDTLFFCRFHCSTCNFGKSRCGKNFNPSPQNITYLWSQWLWKKLRMLAQLHISWHVMRSKRTYIKSISKYFVLEIITLYAHPNIVQQFKYMKFITRTSIIRIR